MNESKMKNTEYTIYAVDAYALEETLHENYGLGSNLENVEIVDLSGGIHGENLVLQFTISRYARNGHGFHVGYERFTGCLQLHKREDLGVYSIPRALSPYVVIPSTLEVDHIEPATEETTHTVEGAREYLVDYWEKDLEWYEQRGINFADLDDEQILQEAYDRGLGEGDYYAPDEDFAWGELNHVLEEALASLMEAKFIPIAPGDDPEEVRNTWTLGRYWFEVGGNSGKED